MVQGNRIKFDSERFIFRKNGVNGCKYAKKCQKRKFWLCSVHILFYLEFLLKDFKICYSYCLFTDDYEILKQLLEQTYGHYKFFDYIISLHPRMIQNIAAGKRVTKRSFWSEMCVSGMCTNGVRVWWSKGGFTPVVDKLICV